MNKIIPKSCSWASEEINDNTGVFATATEEEINDNTGVFATASGELINDVVYFVSAIPTAEDRKSVV